MPRYRPAAFARIAVLAALAHPACATRQAAPREVVPAPPAAPSEVPRAPAAPSPAASPSPVAHTEPRAVRSASEAPVELRPGLTASVFSCAPNASATPVVFHQVRVAPASALRVGIFPNPAAERAAHGECGTAYAGGDPEDFLGRDAPTAAAPWAIVNASLFYRAPGAALPRWRAEGLAWSPPPQGPAAAQAPLQFNECRDERAPIVVADARGLHEISARLAPCAAVATAPHTRDAGARTTDGGASGSAANPERAQWCGTADGPGALGYRHVEACAVLDETAVAALPADARASLLPAGTSERTLDSTALIAAVRSAFPTVSLVVQLTGPWPSLNTGVPGPDGDLWERDAAGALVPHGSRCAGEALVSRRGMNEPVIPGIERAICRALPRTVLCGHADGGVSLVIAEHASLHDLAVTLREGSGCAIDCARAYNFDGGGSTQLVYRNAPARTPARVAWTSPVRTADGTPAAPPCGPVRAPVNFLAVWAAP